ncbi:MAG: hypothetical protein R2710_09130 [Acidimicrobiales bacterium]
MRLDLDLLLDGALVGQWSDLSVTAVPPGATLEVPLDPGIDDVIDQLAADPRMAAGSELQLSVRWSLRSDRRSTGLGGRDLIVLPADHELAFDQLPIAAGRFPTNISVAPERVVDPTSLGADVQCMIDDQDVVHLAAGGSRLAIGPDGALLELVLHGDDVPLATSALSCWRPPTDNDQATFGDERLVYRWDRRGRPIPSATGERPPRIEARDSGVVAATFRIAAGAGLTLRVTWLVGPDGDVGFDIVPDIDLDLPSLLRIGLDLELPLAYDTVTWFGPGPEESYPDRWHGLEVAHYTRSVADQFFPFARPQETGNHTQLRWFAVSSGAGAGGGVPTILAVGDPRFDAAALPYRAAAIEAAEHLNELPVPDCTALRLDIAHAGLGTASCGPGIDGRFRVGGHRVGNRIILRNGGNDPADEARRPSSLGRHRRWHY